MVFFDTCKATIQSCLETKSFAASHLYSDEKTMDIHIHDCYEIYYSISGGKQFLIDDRIYDFKPGDIFFINQYENHYLSLVDSPTHERIVIMIYPGYLRKFSTEQTDLNYCFTHREASFGQKLTLSKEEKKRFMHYMHKLTEPKEFGQDVLDQLVFLELITYLTMIFTSRCAQGSSGMQVENDLQSLSEAHHSLIDQILTYINQNLTEDLSISRLAARFYLSNSYLCKIFKDRTGTTISSYITTKRISRAKSLLRDGYSVMETCHLCGFNDYSAFLKAFTKVVGISPKKYKSYE